jgi:lipopolysaccharide transport system ATP-binding protein
MSLPTESRLPGDTVERLPAVQLKDVSVRYRVPQERIPSIKEYVVRWLRGQVRYKGFWALQETSLVIQKGEVFGIIGPNGAGKSTLLKVIARVLRPTKGSVLVRGMISPLLELGAGFDYELTGRENIYLNSAILGFSKEDIDRRVDRIIDFAGLHGFIDAPLRTYSTGMVARLGFSVATDVRPEILIVDEILSVGDAEFQARSFERIQNFQAEGATILLVSHNLDKVEEMCSRVIWLESGKIVALDSPAVVVEQYKESIRGSEAERLARESGVQFERRWGNRKIEIVGVSLCNETGAEETIFKTGQSLQLMIDYVAREPVESPVFGIAIHRQDGAHITGPNTYVSGLDTGMVHGEGRIMYTIPYLPLLDGLYFFSVASHNREDTEMFDYHHRAYPFRVDNHGGKIKERYGMISLGGEWAHHRLNTLPIKGGEKT